MFAFAKFFMYAGTTLCLFAALMPRFKDQLPPAIAGLDQQVLFIVAGLMVVAGFLGRRMFDPRAS